MKELIASLVQVKDEILLVLALVAGSGGLRYWIDRCRNRVRLYADIISIDALFFKIEVENLGAISTSLRRVIEIKGFDKLANRVLPQALTINNYWYKVFKFLVLARGKRSWIKQR